MAGRTPFEIVAGAILTQNTSWTNVERALTKLREAKLLSIEGIRTLPLADLEQLIRSSGYYRQKADRLKGFVAFLDQRYAGSLEKMFATPTDALRAELLSLKGVGHETADAILLYAGNHEMFVVDAYARRVLMRHGAITDSAKYDEVRMLVEAALRKYSNLKPIRPKNTPPQKILVHQPSLMSRARRSDLSQLYNEMHGLLVQVGKYYCWKAAPNCLDCPLRSLLPSNPVDQETAI